MGRRRKSKDKSAEAMAGLFLIFMVFIWLRTGNLSLVITIFVISMVALFAIGLFLRSRRKKKILTSGIDEIDEMDGKTFEQLLLEYFRKMGYKGKLTSEYADYGADLLLIKDNIRYVVQVKRWNQKVGLKAIQEAVASIKHYKADRGIVITNNYFTNNAKELAKSNAVELWDRNKLIYNMSQVNGQAMTVKMQNENPKVNAADTCPRCGSEIVVKNVKRGKYIGCSQQVLVK
ncbi:MAG: restriction endonuclease [Bacillota bacterium]